MFGYDIFRKLCGNFLESCLELRNLPDLNVEHKRNKGLPIVRQVVSSPRHIKQCCSVDLIRFGIGKCAREAFGYLSNVTKMSHNHAQIVSLGATNNISVQ